MNPFEINLVGEVLTVMPNPNGSFNIIKGDSLLGAITPNMNEDAIVKWTSSDFIAEDYAQQIGELIEEHEM